MDRKVGARERRGAEPRASGTRFGSARFAVTAAFFLHAAVFTNWVPRIPAVQQDLGLTEGGLALVFLGIAAGPLPGPLRPRRRSSG